MGKAGKGRGLRTLVILEEVEDMVAMVSLPLSIDVSPKFCNGKYRKPLCTMPTHVEKKNVNF
jgi:hypothetical protein